MGPDVAKYESIICDILENDIHHGTRADVEWLLTAGSAVGMTG